MGFFGKSFIKIREVLASTLPRITGVEQVILTKRMEKFSTLKSRSFLLFSLGYLTEQHYYAYCPKIQSVLASGLCYSEWLS